MDWIEEISSNNARIICGLIDNLEVLKKIELELLKMAKKNSINKNTYIEMAYQTKLRMENI